MKNLSGASYHLNCFIEIECKPGGVAEEEDNDNGEEQGGHGGVPAVALGDAVVDQGGPGKKDLHQYLVSY